MDQWPGVKQMNTIAAHVAVLNSLLFIKDADTKALPKIDGRGSCWSTPSCVAVSCMPDCDGETEVIIGNSSEILKKTEKLLFDGVLETPTGCVTVQTVLGEKILEQTVTTIRTRLQIWTDGFRDTAKVIIGLE